MNKRKYNEDDFDHDSLDNYFEGLSEEDLEDFQQNDCDFDGTLSLEPVVEYFTFISDITNRPSAGAKIVFDEDNRDLQTAIYLDLAGLRDLSESIKDAIAYLQQLEEK